VEDNGLFMPEAAFDDAIMVAQRRSNDLTSRNDDECVHA
jgi:hypothetical protein